jgi:hypothetical protein
MAYRRKSKPALVARKLFDGSEFRSRLRAAFSCKKLLINLVINIQMKFLLALASGWIGFSLADHVIYGGNHVRLVAGFIGAVVAGFG